MDWAKPLLNQGPVIIYATAAADRVKAAQEKLGVERAGALVEEALAEIARQLVHEGVRQLIVAGGETSGAGIGRAPWRERVCQYVEVSVVAGSLKKKTIKKSEHE